MLTFKIFICDLSTKVIICDLPTSLMFFFCFFLSSSQVLVYFMHCLYRDSWRLFLFVWKKPCRFTSMDNQPKRKNCVSGSRKHWNIVFVVLHYFFIFTMFCFASFSFFHALLSRSLHGKIAVTWPKKLSFIILSLMLFYTWFYNRPVLQSLCFASLCHCCFCK